MCFVAWLFRSPFELLLFVTLLPEHHYCFESTHHALWIQRDDVTPVHMEVSDEMIPCSVIVVSWQFFLSIFKLVFNIFSVVMVQVKAKVKAKLSLCTS